MLSFNYLYTLNFIIEKKIIITSMILGLSFCDTIVYSPSILSIIFPSKGSIN